MKELLQGTQSRYAEYRMKAKPPLLLTIAVTYAKGKYAKGKRGVENLGYVVDGLSWSPRRVHQTYRSRFPIESSYRMCNQVKPRTSTKNPVIRDLYAVISFLLRNVWIALLGMHFSSMKQGPRTIDMRVRIRTVHCHNLGSDPGIDGGGERNPHVASPGLEKGRGGYVE